MSKLVAAAALTTTVGVSGLASPAAAADLPPLQPNASCGTGNQGEIFYDIESAEVQPKITQFISFFVTEGTTGERTESLTEINVVTTMLGASTSSTAEWAPVFGKVSATVGFEVQRTTSTTSNETTTMRWTFNQPGYYGLYKGTRAVSGVVQRWVCDRFWVPTRRVYVPYWVYLGGKSYTTFATMEEGTIRCEDFVPDGSLRQKAQQQLDC